jgi:hypothetical protein
MPTDAAGPRGSVTEGAAVRHPDHPSLRKPTSQACPCLLPCALTP